MVAPTLHLGDDERELVLANSRLERYGAGEIVLRQASVPITSASSSADTPR